MKYLLPLLFITSIFISCVKNSENELNGAWNIKIISCECIFPEFKKGEQVWSFNTDNNKLTVTTTLTEINHPLLDAGVYEFSTTDDRINIGLDGYDYYFESGDLILSDHPEVDGPLIRFVK